MFLFHNFQVNNIQIKDDKISFFNNSILPLNPPQQFDDQMDSLIRFQGEEIQQHINKLFLVMMIFSILFVLTMVFHICKEVLIKLKIQRYFKHLLILHDKKFMRIFGNWKKLVGFIEQSQHSANNHTLKRISRSIESLRRNNNKIKRILPSSFFYKGILLKSIFFFVLFFSASLFCWVFLLHQKGVEFAQMVNYQDKIINNILKNSQNTKHFLVALLEEQTNY